MTHKIQFDFDPNITINQLIFNIQQYTDSDITIHQNPNQPVPSATIEIENPDLVCDFLNHFAFLNPQLLS